ncbi:MAG TPA: ComF family protein [Terriglobales bacterium]|nr:ComF family protein [Terriglobales bacterium]
MIAALVCLLFPSPCRLCGQSLRGARRLPVCGPCLGRLPGLERPGCRQCGQALAAASADGRCLRCQAAPPAYASAQSAAPYRGEARALIHLLKYRGVVPIAGWWAERLARLVPALPQPPELVVPVPLGRRRRRQRGYNQSGEMARRLARRLGCAYAPRGLRRRRETAPQTGLDAAARERNLADAFVGARRRVAGKRVLLVDDVLTTGATARAAAAALLDAGALRVDVVTAARAELDRPEAGEAA